MSAAFFDVLQLAPTTQHLGLEAAAVTGQLDYSSAYDCGRRFSGPSLMSPKCRFDLAKLPVKVCIPNVSVSCQSYGTLTSDRAATLIQVRTGHCRLNQYLAMIGWVESDLCECRKTKRRSDISFCRAHSEQKSVRNSG
jgi:hypothetical protein